LDHHLGQEGEQAAGNFRNGSSPKTVLTDTGKLELAILATVRAASSRR
jgi:transposase-like protein